MIKASAGGGGKGMRIAWNDDETKWDILSVFNYMQLFFIIITCIQGCALAEPGGPWRQTFALGRIENHRFFIQLICWAP